MPSFMTSEDSIPCSTPLAEKLMQVIMATDSKALEADQPATGLSVDVLHGEIYIYADADELFMESVENSDIPKVVGEILTEAGLPFLHCGVGWNENKAAAGPTSGGYFFRFLASGEIDFAKARLFPSDEWIWHCPNCGKTTIHDYDALAAVGIPKCVDCCLTYLDMVRGAGPENDEYIDSDVCRASDVHLSDCDDDGYCNLCGEQES